MYANGIRGGGVFSENYTLTGRSANLFKNSEMTSLTKPVSTLSKVGKFVGTGSFIAGTLMDGVGVMKYYKNPNSPNAVHPAKALVNTGFSVWGIGISRIGLRANPIVAALYSGVEAFYPGGWLGDSKHSGALKVMADAQNRDRQMLGYYPKD